MNKPKQNQYLKIIRILVFLFVFGLSVIIFVNKDEIQHLDTFGYPGLFILSILSNATVIVPVPGVILTSAMGILLNPLYVAIVAGAVASLGELSGYLAGFSGQGVIENASWYEKVEKWMKSYGYLTIAFLAFIPNPAFDMAGISAGAMKMPVWKFLIMCFIGKALKMLFFAYGGALIPGLFE